MFQKRQGNQRRSTCRSCEQQHGRKVRLVRQHLTERLSAQDYRCAACDEHLTSPHVDIDWARLYEPGTACFRGLLCLFCNALAGHAHDDPKRLRLVADHIERTTR
jgi:hypothetical protein